MNFKTHEKPAAIEDLTFEVKLEKIEEFIRYDHEIWTLFLAGYDDKMTKEVWIDAEEKGKIVTIIYWSDYKLWKSIPQEELIKTQKRFDDAIGTQNYKFVSASHTQAQLYRKHEYSEG